jgi:hypothetical protein
MSRIDGKGIWSYNSDVLDRVYPKPIHCANCQKAATIWIRLNDLDAGKIKHADLLLCEAHAFHLARILMQDIGHIKDVVYPKPGEPTP